MHANAAREAWMDERTFKDALGRWASGVAVVTCKTQSGQPVGLTVSSFSSLSLSPPLVLFCLGNRSSLLEDFAQASHFAVNILKSGQDALSNRFAFGDTPPFEGLAHSEGRGGAPLLPDALASLECRIEARHPGGDHVIYVGEVEAASVADGTPLVYSQGKYHHL